MNKYNKIIPFKVLTALRFFAQGSYQLSVGDCKFISLSQSSVSKCVNEVVTALNQPEIFNRYVMFPATNELKEIRTR